MGSLQIVLLCKLQPKCCSVAIYYKNLKLGIFVGFETYFLINFSCMIISHIFMFIRILSFLRCSKNRKASVVFGNRFCIVTLSSLYSCQSVLSLFNSSEIFQANISVNGLSGKICSHGNWQLVISISFHMIKLNTNVTQISSFT